MCPHCGELLVTFEWEGIETDHCVACKGTWLDAGELEEIVERAGGSGEQLRAELKSSGESKHGKRKCARCRAILRGVTLGAVDLDRCPYGHGIWFDKGELDAVAKARIPGAGDFVKSFLGEMFSSALSGGIE